MNKYEITQYLAVMYSHCNLINPKDKTSKPLGTWLPKRTVLVRRILKLPKYNEQNVSTTTLLGHLTTLGKGKSASAFFVKNRSDSNWTLLAHKRQ